MNFKYNWVFTFIFIIVSYNSINAQTLIINEFSNGPSGAQEYIEFIVVDDNAFYDCGNSAPPCVDIRGWIIDDNSGYHGTGGVAAGCNRFSLDPFWQCIPIGTIITIYNDAERNGSLPPDDISMSDNNCRLIIPINNTQLFDNNATTPGAIACSYPSTGWVAGGNWTRIGMRNDGDCARLVNLAGCEVSSICYGDVSLNTQIYFSGVGVDNVWSFSDGNSTVQANWAEGCADNETLLDAGTCGANNQTPGVANNTLNSAYIAQFNNNCQPIQPLALTLAGTTSQSCTCDGSASISASGSIGPYTYAWYDNFNVPLGQTSATATNLCSGNYYCVVTSSIDCKDTIPVFVGSICSNFGTFASATMIQNCVNNQFYNTTWANLADQINPSGILFNGYDYGPYFQNSNTLILTGGEVKTFKNSGSNVCGAKLYYTVYTVGNQPANPVYTILDLPFKESCNVGPNNFPTGGPCFNATDQKWAKENYNIDLTIYPPGDYVLEVYYVVPGSFTSTTACNDTIYVNNNGNNYKALFQIKPQPVISGGPLNICPGNNSTLTSNFTSGNSWSTTSTNQSIPVNSSGTYTLTVNLNNNCPNLSDNETINVYAAPTLEAGANQTTCGGSGAISLNGVIGGSATGAQWVSPSGTFSNANSLNTTFTPTITSGVATVILSATGPCPTVQDQLVVLVNATPTVNAGNDQTICAGSSVNLSGVFGGSANSILWTAPSGIFSNTTSTTSTYTPSISSGSVTLTLTASGPCPSVSDQVTINVNAPTTPTFTQIPPICSGGAITLPTTSLNGITGAWSPAVNNTATTLYTFTPTAGLCANSTTMTIVVNETPTVDAGNNASVCVGNTVNLNGLIGGSATSAIWSASSGTFSDASNLTSTYTPSITSGSITLTLATSGPCPSVNDQVTISIVTSVLPTFNAQGPYCSGDSFALPSASTNGIFGTWSPAINNTATTTYTFTPNSGQCANSASFTINVNPIVTPTFTQISPICSGGAITLPTTSLNGITGAWSPAVNNTATTVYTFTPTAGLCANSTTMTIEVNETPTVDAGNNASVCVGNTINLNGLIGGSATSAFWSAASGTFSDASNLTSSYTPFITSGSITLTLATSGPCPSVNDQVTISIVTSVLPTFNAQGPYCSGDSFTLPNASTNGIFGTWSPLINNTATATYTFTPTAGQCANSASLTIDINPIVTPTFTQIPPICSGETFTLPTTSLNGITGIWSPAVNNTATTVYTFTPTAGQCASSATMTVAVNSQTLPTFNQVAPICSGGSFVLPSTSTNGISGTWSPAINNTTSTNYSFVPTAGQCATNASMTVAVNPTYTINDSRTICPNQIPYVWNGITFNGPGNQSATLSTINSCDSIVNMTLNVSSTITSTTNLNVCNSDLPYSWNGLTFNSVGSQSANLTATSGCDSVATLNLTVYSTQTSNASLTVCQSQIPYTWNGLTFNGSGTQSVTLQDINGCDSLATLILQVANTLTSSSTISICPSDLPFTWNGLTFSSAGTQTVNLLSVGGCDSLATLTLNILPTYNEVENVTICSNETPYFWNGISLNSTTNQTLTLSSLNGCDSVVTLNLTVLPVYTTTLDSIVCQNELPLIWNGLTFNVEGEQTLTLNSINGCDSLITMNVQVLELPQVSISGGGVYCEYDAIQPIVVNATGSAPFNVSYTLNGVGANETSNQTPIFLGNIPGIYILTEVSDQNCIQNSNLGNASIVINPTPNAPQLSNDSTYCLNYVLDTLVAIGNQNAQILWYDQPVLQNSIQLGNFYYPDNILGATTYYVVQEQNGCFSPPNDVTITFENCDVIIPTAFTPDGDNVNDTWILDGIDAIFPNNLVSIYNRWGNLIYQSEQGKYESNSWDGKYNDKQMPVGSYYFIIEFNDDQTQNKTGIVSIIK